MLQAVDIMAEGLALPAAVLTVVTVAVLVGFPLALIAAWVYERRPEGGLKRTEQALSEEIQEIVPQPRSRRWTSGLRSRRWTSGLLALAGTALYDAARDGRPVGQSKPRQPQPFP